MSKPVRTMERLKIENVVFQQYFRENSLKIKSLENDLEKANKIIEKLKNREHTIRKQIEDELSNRILNYNLNHKRIRMR